MAVAMDQYKAHFWTWTNSWEEFNQVGPAQTPTEPELCPPFPSRIQGTGEGHLCGLWVLAPTYWLLLH